MGNRPLAFRKCQIRCCGPKANDVGQRGLLDSSLKSNVETVANRLRRLWLHMLPLNPNVLERSHCGGGRSRVHLSNICGASRVAWDAIAFLEPIPNPPGSRGITRSNKCAYAIGKAVFFELIVKPPFVKSNGRIPVRSFKDLPAYSVNGNVAVSQRCQTRGNARL